MQKEIIKLLFTFLGRFKFFQEFVTILMSMDEKLTEVDLTIKQIQNEMKTLIEEKNELEEKVSHLVPKEPDKPVNFSSAADIIQKKFDAYHEQ